jgi:hypothetical protein
MAPSCWPDIEFQAPRTHLIFLLLLIELVLVIFAAEAHPDRYVLSA